MEKIAGNSPRVSIVVGSTMVMNFSMDIIPLVASSYLRCGYALEAFGPLKAVYCFVVHEPAY